MIQEKAMIGYITDGGKVSAIEPSWNLGDLDHLGKFLINNWPTREHAIQLIDKGGIGVFDFKKNDYWYVDGFGDVICTQFSFNKEEHRPHIKHLYLWMKGEWQYSDCGIDWTPVREIIKETA